VRPSFIFAIRASPSAGLFHSLFDIRFFRLRSNRDEFRVTGRPFPPHPHAGFSAVTYVLEDSEGKLRSRDSLGNDLVTGPGGIVWTQAGSGLIHEELPADSNRELHAVQVFVNLSSRNLSEETTAIPW
jgi:redox-sensitive bicupin YhaK (pirin superfamily)